MAPVLTWSIHRLANPRKGCASIVISTVCLCRLSLCLSLCEDIAGTTLALYTKCLVHVAYGRDSIFLRRKGRSLLSSIALFCMLFVYAVCYVTVLHSNIVAVSTPSLPLASFPFLPASPLFNPSPLPFTFPSISSDSLNSYSLLPFCPSLHNPLSVPSLPFVSFRPLLASLSPPRESGSPKIWNLGSVTGCPGGYAMTSWHCFRVSNCLCCLFSQFCTVISVRFRLT